MKSESEYIQELCPINTRAYNLFKEYKKECSVFIECGCHIGQTCEKAVFLGYEKIYSCDIYEDLVEQTKDRLKKYDIQHDIKHQNSENFLKELLPTIYSKATIWLDAHPIDGQQTGIPLFKELDIIKEKSLHNNHSILIDDLQIFFSNQIEEIKDKIKSINPNYKINFGYVHNRGLNNPDILIADL